MCWPFVYFCIGVFSSTEVDGQDGVLIKGAFVDAGPFVDGQNRVLIKGACLQKKIEPAFMNYRLHSWTTAFMPSLNTACGTRVEEDNTEHVDPKLIQEYCEWLLNVENMEHFGREKLKRIHEFYCGDGREEDPKSATRMGWVTYQQLADRTVPEYLTKTWIQMETKFFATKIEKSARIGADGDFGNADDKLEAQHLNGANGEFGDADYTLEAQQLIRRE